MKDIYAWVPWFQELARKVAEGGEAGLIERAKQIVWAHDSPALLNYGDENIDPFSFLYTLASKNDISPLKPVYRNVSKIFDIDCDRLFSEDSQSHGLCFPVPPGVGTLFHNKGEGDPKLLWKLFRQAQQDGEIDPNDFSKALDINGVAVRKLTQCLFLINPLRFLPIDHQTLRFHEDIGLPAFTEADNQIREKDSGLKNYQSLLKKFQHAFPKCDFYEINTVLYRMKQWKDVDKVRLCQNFFQVSTNVLNDDKDLWDNFSENNHVFTGGPGSGGWDENNQNQPTTQGQKNYPLEDPQVGDIILVRCGNSDGYAVGIVFHNDYANGLSEQSEVNKKMRIHVLWLNKNHTENLGLSGQTPGFYDARKYSVYEKFKNLARYKDTFAFIEKVQDTENGETHPENGDNQMKRPLNQILYGPPGTGKTWNTVNHALAIIEDTEVKEFEKEDRKIVKQRFDELKESGQIEMVTFHQNFAYEDFIEGIRPVLDGGSDDSNNVRYEIVDGVFKRISNRAKENLTKSSQKTETFDLNSLLHDFAQYINQKIEQGDIIKLFPEERWHTQITYTRTLNNGKIQFRLCLGNAQTNYAVSTNTILRDYTKFISGEIKSHRDIKPTHKSKSEYHGDSIYLFHLMKHIKTYQDSEWEKIEQEVETKQNHVLIIDEINRGNIAKIFGELITLIEDTKRIGNEDSMTVALPYSSNSKDEDDSFGVPNNLYIIGTMNTADRSIALLDTALRRRFDFIEMMPEPYHPFICKDIDGVNCQELLAMMNKRITALLDREHQIGHSYLMEVDSMEKLANVFQNKIIPLLQEYFYDDWAKIDLALNKNKFVTTTKIEGNLLGDTELVDANRSIYELIEAKSLEWKNPENYKKIYATTQTQSDDVDGE